MLEKLIYRSETTAPMTMGELAALLQQARDRNAVEDVTGLLLYRDGVFLQWFEGEHTAVADTWERIRADRRHHRLEVLVHARVAARRFSDWRMGFFEVEDEALRRLQAFRADRRQPLLSLALIHDAQLADALLCSYG